MEPRTWLLLKGFVGIMCSGTLLCYRWKYENYNNDRDEKGCITCVAIADFSVDVLLMLSGSIMYFHDCEIIRSNHMDHLILASLIFDYLMFSVLAFIAMFARHLLKPPYTSGYDQL